MCSHWRVLLYDQSDELAQLQQKISEINAKCILLKQRKNAGACELESSLGRLCRVAIRESASLTLFVVNDMPCQTLVATTELVKTSTTKAKLEQLCRELQKQNKLIVVQTVALELLLLLLKTSSRRLNCCVRIE